MYKYMLRKTTKVKTQYFKLNRVEMKMEIKKGNSLWL